MGADNLDVDDHQCSTVDGLYAAGDVVTDLHQLSVAFGHATIAATDIHKSIGPQPALARTPCGQIRGCGQVERDTFSISTAGPSA
jgi:thioredoxin reductase (NADPH)